MSPIIRNILALIAGLAVGSAVNMGIIILSYSIVPPPAGTDTSTMEGLAHSLPLFGPEHYLFPFLAHALGTLTGAFIATRLSATHKFKFAYAVGVLFLIGGISNIVMLPSPLWFTFVDLVFAYIPMAYVGGKLATRNNIS